MTIKIEHLSLPIDINGKTPVLFEDFNGVYAAESVSGSAPVPVSKLLDRITRAQRRIEYLQQGIDGTLARINAAIAAAEQGE